LRQSIWCRQHGIEPKYFSLWKSKLAKARALAAEGISAPVSSNATRPAMVPVTIRSSGLSKLSRPVVRWASLDSINATPLSLNVMFPNGIGLAFELASARALAPLLVELAHLPC
jgi:hypothetical protein